MSMGILPTCVFVHHMCAGGKGQKRVPDLLKPELQTIMSCQRLKPGFYQRNNALSCSSALQPFL